MINATVLSCGAEDKGPCLSYTVSRPIFTMKHTMSCINDIILLNADGFISDLYICKHLMKVIIPKIIILSSLFREFIFQKSIIEERLSFYH